MKKFLILLLLPLFSIGQETHNQGVIIKRMPVVTVVDTMTATLITGEQAKISVADLSNLLSIAAGNGDMTKAIYDANLNNIVDNSERLNAQLPAFYLDNTDAQTLSISNDTLTISGGNFVKIPTGGNVDSVNGQTGVVVLTTNNINEGATNLYYTDTRVTNNASVQANTAKLTGHIIQEEGVSVTQRNMLNFVGASVTVSDDAINGKTLVTIDGGGGSGVTNLTYTASATQGQVNSDTGTDAVIPAGDTVNASLMLPGDKTKLNGIETGATADQIASEVPFTNTTSGLTAINVQAAIDEVEARVDINDAKVSNATHTGDVTGATTLTISDNAVTNVKAADMAVNTIKGRITTGTGDPEDLTAAQVRTIINVADGATANSTDAFLLSRTNHTGTQTAATISDFDTEVSNNTSVAANTAKLSGHVIQDEGTSLTQRANLNFVGTGVTVTDDSVNNRSVVTIAGGGGSANVQKVDISITNPVIAGGVNLTSILASAGVGKAYVIHGFNFIANGFAAATGNSSVGIRYAGDGATYGSTIFAAAAGGNYIGNVASALSRPIDATNLGLNVAITNTTDQTLSGTLHIQVLYNIVDATTGF